MKFHDDELTKLQINFYTLVNFILAMMITSAIGFAGYTVYRYFFG